MEIRKLEHRHKTLVQALVWEVFEEFEVPSYKEEGVEEFRKFLFNKNLFDEIEAWGAYQKQELIGIIASNHHREHICLFFVKKQYHHQGIGKALWNYFLQESSERSISVNSSLYASDIYHRLGFKDGNTEQITNGIPYIPMLYNR